MMRKLGLMKRGVAGVWILPLEVLGVAGGVRFEFGSVRCFLVALFLVWSLSC